MKDCRKHKKLPTQSQMQNFWTNCVSFYFDGVTFTHKYNPLEEAQKQ